MKFKIANGFFTKGNCLHICNFLLLKWKQRDKKKKIKSCFCIIYKNAYSVVWKQTTFAVCQPGKAL